MFKSCISTINSNLFTAYKSFICPNGTLKNMPNITNSVSRLSSILAHNGKVQCNTSFLRIQEVNVTPVRNKNIKHDSAEAHRVLAADRYNGERTSCEAVTKRFFRLHWGAWIRTKTGSDRNLHLKKGNRLRRLRQHVFCNAQQSALLDKMAGPWYTRPHYYVDDPYEPYHKREEFLHSRRKPLPPS